MVTCGEKGFDVGLPQVQMDVLFWSTRHAVSNSRAMSQPTLECWLHLRVVAGKDAVAVNLIIDCFIIGSRGRRNPLCSGSIANSLGWFHFVVVIAVGQKHHRILRHPSIEQNVIIDEILWQESGWLLWAFCQEQSLSKPCESAFCSTKQLRDHSAWTSASLVSSQRVG